MLGDPILLWVTALHGACAWGAEAAGAWLVPSEHWGHQCPLAQMHSLPLYSIS